MLYLQKRNQTYYFRIRIPHDIAHWFEVSEIKQSLRIKSHLEAKRFARMQASRAERLFSLIRSGVVNGDQVQVLIEQEFPGNKTKQLGKNKPLRLVDVVQAYVNEHKLTGRWTKKTEHEVDSCLSVFVQIVGNRLICSVDRTLMVAYVENLKRLPPNMNVRPEYRGMNIRQLISLEIAKPISQRTLNKYISRVSSFMKWAMRQGYIEWNPAEGLTVSVTEVEADERKAYISEDINKLVGNLGRDNKGKPERFWVPLIGMYSGMRLNEICQLYVSDVIELDGLVCFDVNDEADKRLKNKSSRRVVPVHPELLKLGLMEYVERMKGSDNPRLWMNLSYSRDGYGQHFSRWFQRYNRKYITDDQRKVFHSLRHNVADTLKQAGVETSVISELLGHSHEKGNMTLSRYGKRYRPKVLLDALMKLDYGLDL